MYLPRRKYLGTCILDLQVCLKSGGGFHYSPPILILIRRIITVNMASKRTAEDDTESRAPRNKRHKPTRTDPTSGQRGAFGDLGSATTTAPTGDSDLDCEDDSEALAYLRSVR